MKNELKKRVKPIKNVYSINMALIYPDASGPCGPISYDYILQNENAFGWTYNEFSDELSRKSYLTYLNSKISSMFDDSVPMVNKCQYFCDDIIHLSAEESFIDCGAFNGDTVESFIIALKDRSIETYKSIYAFEPDADNFAKLNSLTQKYPNLYCINKGVYSEQTELRFKIGDMQSTIKNNGETSVAVDTIDNIIHEESGREISFIKMDIEGSELSALKGAEQTIRNYKPKLAICAYHKAEDLITIPQYIKSLVPEYNLFFRLHEPCTFEAVLYAVCD
jgi:FkbM family methyltransferase